MKGAAKWRRRRLCIGLDLLARQLNVLIREMQLVRHDRCTYRVHQVLIRPITEQLTVAGEGHSDGDAAALRVGSASGCDVTEGVSRDVDLDLPATLDVDVVFVK
jgi:hypothetical protein